MVNALETGAVSVLADAVLQTAAYADIFDYPLTGSEIHRYLIGTSASKQAVEHLLQDTPLLPHVDGYYTLPGREMLVKIRRRREEVSAQLWRPAVAYGRSIARLPFVRMVAVTGALAMDNVEAGADIDYMIVTEPDRLWFCRGLILLIGRLAKRRGYTLCPNYLVSLRKLDFPDQNLYAAHEIAQMAPLAGEQVYAAIRNRNKWVERFLPNACGAPPVRQLTAQPVPGTLSRPALEAALLAPPFTALERWEMQRKIKKLRREQRGSPESDFSADTCKGHKHQHQARTQAAMEERLDRLDQGMRG